MVDERSGVSVSVGPIPPSAEAALVSSAHAYLEAHDITSVIQSLVSGLIASRPPPEAWLSFAVQHIADRMEPVPALGRAYLFLVDCCDAESESQGAGSLADAVAHGYAAFREERASWMRGPSPGDYIRLVRALLAPFNQPFQCRGGGGHDDDGAAAADSSIATTTGGSGGGATGRGGGEGGAGPSASLLLEELLVPTHVAAAAQALASQANSDHQRRRWQTAAALSMASPPPQQQQQQQHTSVGKAFSTANGTTTASGNNNTMRESTERQPTSSSSSSASAAAAAAAAAAAPVRTADTTSSGSTTTSIGSSHRDHLMTHHGAASVLQPSHCIDSVEFVVFASGCRAACLCRRFREDVRVAFFQCASAATTSNSSYSNSSSSSPPTPSRIVTARALLRAFPNHSPFPAPRPLDQEYGPPPPPSSSSSSSCSCVGGASSRSASPPRRRPSAATTSSRTHDDSLPLGKGPLREALSVFLDAFHSGVAASDAASSSLSSSSGRSRSSGGQQHDQHRRGVSALETWARGPLPLTPLPSPARQGPGRRRGSRGGASDDDDGNDNDDHEADDQGSGDDEEAPKGRPAALSAQAVEAAVEAVCVRALRVLARDAFLSQY